MNNIERLSIDVSGLVSEAQSVARQVAEIYFRYTQPWFIGLICFGSGVKGGILQGASDIDFHLYLEDNAFVDLENLVLPLELCLAIQQDLANVNPAPFQYIDGGPERAFIPPGHMGPIPGNYWLVSGRLPVKEADNAEIKANAREALKQLQPETNFLTEGLFHTGNGSGSLAITVRLLTQFTWPILYSLLALRSEDAIQAWATPKNKAVLLLPEWEPTGQASRAFYQAVQAYYHLQSDGDKSVVLALEVIQKGVTFLRTAKAWWNSTL